MSRYPVIRHRELRPSFRWSALCQRIRPLKAGPAEVLVYETATAYVTRVDPGHAVAVSLVDMRKDRPVTLRRVRRGLNVRVTGYFNCWVTDPVEVVHARHLATMRHIRRLMRESLLAVPGFVHSDSEDLRRRLAAWFANRMTPTPIPGMRIIQDGMATHLRPPRVEREHDPDYTEA